MIELVTFSGMGLQLREMQEGDLEQILQLERNAHSHPWRRSSFEECLKGRQKCWLAEYKNRLVGYMVVAHAGGDAELLNLAVLPELQRKGIGQLLLVHAMELVKGKADMLFLEVRVSNRKAIELYSREGFFEIGNRKNYYPTNNGYEDALLMAKQL